MANIIIIGTNPYWSNANVEIDGVIVSHDGHAVDGTQWGYDKGFSFLNKFEYSPQSMYLRDVKHLWVGNGRNNLDKFIAEDDQSWYILLLSGWNAQMDWTIKRYSGMALMWQSAARHGKFAGMGGQALFRLSERFGDGARYSVEYTEPGHHSHSTHDFCVEGNLFEWTKKEVANV